MPIEHFYGLHATCTAHARAILEEGFLLSPEDRYLGPGVYFFDRDKGGEKFAERHRAQKVHHGRCAENDTGTILSAKITADRDRVLDLEEEDFVQALEELQKNFWEEYNQITNMPRAEKMKRLNRRRNQFLRTLVSALFDRVDVVKAALPCGARKYGSGFVVYTVDCISEIACWGMSDDA